MRGWLRCFNAWDLMASFVIHISDSKLHDVNVLDMLLPTVGAFCFKDRVYMDLERLFELQRAGAFLCFRALSNTRYQLVSPQIA